MLTPESFPSIKQIHTGNIHVIYLAFSINYVLKCKYNLGQQYTVKQPDGQNIKPYDPSNKTQ